MGEKGSSLLSARAWSVEMPDADGALKNGRAEMTLGSRMSERKSERQSGRTITRADLSEAVYQRVGLSRT